MSGKFYNVILTGEYFDGITSESATSTLARLFRITEDQAQRTLHKAPLAIKKAVDEVTAKRFQVALKEANIGVRIQLVPSTRTVIRTTSTTAKRSFAKDRAALDGLSLDRPTRSVYESENPKGFGFKIEGRPDFAFLTVRLSPPECLKVESSSMATMDTHIIMKSRKGGFGRSGESLFINEFSAEDAPGEIGIAPGIPGDILHRHIEGESLFLKSSAYLASSLGVEIETELDVPHETFSGAGLVLIKCSGEGDLWFNTCGAAIEIDVDGEYVIDTEKIVAWTAGLQYKVTSVDGYESPFFPGEGFVCRFSGKGKLWIQARSAKALTSWAHWFRPTKGRG